MSAQAVFPVGDTAMAASPRLRLTRRGRAVLGALATVAVAAVLALIAAFAAPEAQASDAANGEQQFQYVVVQPDSSLWSVATQLDPSADPRDLVAEIVGLNQLDGSGVQAGQPIAVPLRFAEAPGVMSAEEVGI